MLDNIVADSGVEVVTTSVSFYSWTEFNAGKDDCVLLDEDLKQIDYFPGSGSRSSTMSSGSANAWPVKAMDALDGGEASPCNSSTGTSQTDEPTSTNAPQTNGPSPTNASQTDEPDPINASQTDEPNPTNASQTNELNPENTPQTDEPNPTNTPQGQIDLPVEEDGYSSLVCTAGLLLLCLLFV